MDSKLLQSLWNESIKPQVFGNTTQSENPTTVFLGGQPGAGKTKGQAIIKRQFGSKRIAQIVGDDFRLFHPDYRHLLETDPLRMPEVTAPAAGAWVRMSVQYAHENQISCIIEGTWRNPDTVLNTASEAKALGRATRAVLVAVPPALSLTGIAERFYRDMLGGKPARWTPPTAHDETIKNLTNTVRLILTPENAQSLMDEVTITNRQGELLYSGVPRQAAVQVFVENFERKLALPEARPITDTLPVLEAGHHRFTANNLSAAKVIDRIRQSIGEAPQWEAQIKPQTRKDLGSSIKERSKAKMEACQSGQREDKSLGKPTKPQRDKHGQR